MNQAIILTILEFVASVLVEGIILSFVFMWISNQASEKNQQNLQREMNNIETQNKLIYEQLQLEIRNAKQDVISQIKESEK
jgi:uncharacterized membrane-anchored protein YhcB (DUF1043 family)